MLIKENFRGVIFIIDELGKFLEYEARHYGANDIYLLQALAEKAFEGGKSNVFLFVMMHQAFEQYAKGLGQALRDLWSRTVNQDQFDTEAVEQGDVVDDVGEVFVLRNFTAKHQDESLVSVSIYVGRGIPEPANMRSARSGHCTG